MADHRSVYSEVTARSEIRREQYVFKRCGDHGFRLFSNQYIYFNIVGVAFSLPEAE